MAPTCDVNAPAVFAPCNTTPRDALPISGTGAAPEIEQWAAAMAGLFIGCRRSLLRAELCSQSRGGASGSEEHMYGKKGHPRMSGSQNMGRALT